MFTKASPNSHADVEYARDHALLIAKAIIAFSSQGYNQQMVIWTTTHITKRIENIQRKGHDVAMKELDQLHK